MLIYNNTNLTCWLENQIFFKNFFFFFFGKRKKKRRERKREIMTAYASLSFGPIHARLLVGLLSLLYYFVSHWFKVSRSAKGKSKANKGPNSWKKSLEKRRIYALFLFLHIYLVTPLFLFLSKIKMLYNICSNFMLCM